MKSLFDPAITATLLIFIPVVGVFLGLMYQAIRRKIWEIAALMGLGAFIITVILVINLIVELNT